MLHVCGRSRCYMYMVEVDVTYVIEVDVTCMW